MEVTRPAAVVEHNCKIWSLRDDGVNCTLPAVLEQLPDYGTEVLTHPLYTPVGFWRFAPRRPPLSPEQDRESRDAESVVVRNEGLLGDAADGRMAALLPLPEVQRLRVQNLTDPSVFRIAVPLAEGEGEDAEGDGFTTAWMHALSSGDIVRTALLDAADGPRRTFYLCSAFQKPHEGARECATAPSDIAVPQPLAEGDHNTR